MHDTYRQVTALYGPQEHPCNQGALGQGMAPGASSHVRCALTESRLRSLPFQSIWLWQDIGQAAAMYIAAACARCPSQRPGSRCPCFVRVMDGAPCAAGTLGRHINIDAQLGNGMLGRQEEARHTGSRVRKYLLRRGRPEVRSLRAIGQPEEA